MDSLYQIPMTFDYEIGSDAKCVFSPQKVPERREKAGSHYKNLEIFYKDAFLIFIFKSFTNHPRNIL